MTQKGQKISPMTYIHVGPIIRSLNWVVNCNPRKF